MSIIDVNTMQIIECISIPFTAVINKYIAAIIIERQTDLNHYKALLAITEKRDNCLVVLNSIEFELDEHLCQESIVMAGTGDESVYLTSNENQRIITTIDSTDPSSVVVNDYLLSPILTE